VVDHERPVILGEELGERHRAIGGMEHVVIDDRIDR
jgi:hypothetical protein